MEAKMGKMRFEAVSALGADYLPDLNALWKVVSPKSDPITERDLDFMFQVSSPSQLFVCIDEASGRLVGQVWVTISKTSSPKKAEFDEVATLKEFERHGIGTRLMDMAENYAREKGAKKFRLTSAPYRKEAIKFYLNRGYEIINTNVMGKKL